MKAHPPMLYVNPPMTVHAAYRVHDSGVALHVDIKDSDYAMPDVTLMGSPEWMEALARALLEAVDTVKHENGALATIRAHLPDGSTGELDLD